MISTPKRECGCGSTHKPRYMVVKVFECGGAHLEQTSDVRGGLGGREFGQGLEMRSEEVEKISTHSFGVDVAV